MDATGPLSFEQEWLWLLDSAMPGLTAYNVPRALRLTGPLDVRALEQALSYIVERQGALRTTFRLGANADGEQVVGLAAPIALAIEDLSHLTGDAQQAAVQARLSAVVNHTFDLRNDALFRAALLRLGPDVHVLSLLTHHVVSDGGSREIVFRELIAAYDAFSRGQRPSLPALPLQYVDFARAQRARLQGPALDAVVEYWRTKLVGAPVSLDLPTDRPRTSALTFAGTEVSTAIPRELASAINTTAQAHGVTVNMLVLAAFQALLSRYTAQDDIVVGCPVSGRDEQVDDVIGFFANVLPFRISLAGDPTFAEFLERVSDMCLDVYEHAEMPLEPLMRALQKDGRAARAPLFQAMMVLEHEGGALSPLGKATIEVLPHRHEAVVTDIALIVRTSPAGMRMALQYRTDLFDAETAERMLGHMMNLVSGAVRSPGTTVSRLPLLSAAERAKVTTEWNDTEAPFPTGRGIQELIREQAEKTPDAIAVISGTDRLTYAEVETRAEGLANHLRTLGVQLGELVGVTAIREAETVVNILGILKAGAAYVPLDPTYPAERIAFIAGDSELRLVVGRPGSLPPLGELARVTMVSPDASAPADPNAPLPKAAGDSLAYIIYTSGSTGKPKGVLVTHENLMTSTWARVLRYHEPLTRYLLLSSFAFDSSVAGLFWTLIQGGALVVPQEGQHLDAVTLCTLLREEKISHLLAIPSFYQVLLSVATKDDLVTLRNAMTGGDWCPEELIIKHKELAPNASFNTEYGPTETTVWCSVLEIQPSDPIPRVTIGTPMANSTMYILDKNLEPTPINVPGEIYLGGVNVSAGFLKRPELTEQLFIKDPFISKFGGRMYKSGERGRWLSNGQVDFLGRVDHQVKVNGHRIELGEVETAFLREPRVRDAAVLVHGTGSERRLVGYVELREGEPRTANDAAVMRQSVRRFLPEYMVPATIIVMDKFPLNANGKVDRHALPTPESLNEGPAYVAPSGTIQETIATVMADVLGVERVGANDDFFALGGSSLVAMRLMARLSRALDVRLTWATLFDASTVSTLAARVRDLLAAADGSAVRAEAIPPHTGDVAPLSFAQELLWLLDRSVPGLNAYNVPMAFRVAGSIDVPSLEHALAALIARHDTLRTTFGAEGSGAAGQRANAPRGIGVAQVDLRGVPAARREEELSRRVREAIRAPFDITRDTLLRATLFQLDETASCLLLVSHHIIFDEFSSHVVLRELSALYEHHRRGTPANLPALPIRYADYAAWQRDSAERGGLARQLAYWRERLKGLPTLELPTMGPRPAAPKFEGARRRYLLPADLLERFRKIAAAHDATLYMAFLAAVKALLHRYSGQTDIVVGAPITTRNRAELEPLIGYFPNVLVLRTQLDGDPSFSELLARVRATCVGAFANQDVPQEKLSLELKEAGRSATDPLIQVLFLMESAVAQTQQFGDAELTKMPVDFGTSKFDITLAMAEREEGLAAVIEYRTDLFDEATIDRMFGHLHMLLDSLATNVERPISDGGLLTSTERQQVSRWNATARPYPRDTTLHSLIEKQVAATPNAPAVQDERATLTYAQLDVRANQLAHRLRALGVKPGDLVGIAVERSVEMLVGLIGTLKSGGAYVPIDPELPADRIAFMLEDSAVRALLTQTRFAQTVVAAGAPTILLDDPEAFAGQPTTTPTPVATANDPAYMIYTSGSTGRPKGAVNAHSGVVNRLLWGQDEFHLQSSDVVLQKTPYSFDVSVFELFWPSIVGAKLVMARPGGHRDTTYLVDVLTNGGITVCHFVPSMLRAFLANPAAAECTNVRDVMASGEALPPDLVADFYRALPSARLHNLYGPTECAVEVSYWHCPPSTEPPPVIPIGFPVANTQLYVLDARLNHCPVGVAGELYLAGRQVGLGYHNRPELTAERFISDPFSSEPGARMYRTGDRARWRPDGTVEYLGRLDFQVKVRGFRIELGEIETTLARHSDVRDVAVMAHDDGGGDARLVAYVVPAPQASAATTDESVERWREVFDRTYENTDDGADTGESGFNIVGWISSYDKQPIPAAQMREWVDRTCDRILDLAPKRVIELGCGTGLLLFRIAPHVEHYHGMDIAAVGLESIRRDPAFAAIQDKVTLAPGRADETTDLPAGSFDTVVINSVIQYFPSVEYLVQVLERAVRLVAPGGSIFVGDVRMLPLLETLHTSVALYEAKGDVSISDLRAQAQQRLWHESELVLDPAFFETLRVHLPRIGEADVLLKRGAASNELTKFRGDVVLRIDHARPPVPTDATPAMRVESLDDVRSLLRGEPAVVRLADLIDARIGTDLHARDAIAQAPAQGTVRDLRIAPVDGGLEPEALAMLHPNYEVALLWPQSGIPGRFDAILRRRDALATIRGESAPRTGVLRPWSDFMHHPPSEAFSPEQAARWRAHLGASLPDYMIPSSFVRLESLPLTSSGKVDRKMLTPPVVRRPSRAYIAPRTPTEVAIVAVWEEILRVDRVGVEDGFLDLGGHSLLAMRVVGRVRREMGISVALDSLVRGGTAAEFAAAVDAARGAVAAPDDDEFSLAPVSREAYRRV